MRTKRALLGLLLVVALVLVMATPAIAAFPDIAGTPDETSINSLAALDIIGGYGNGNFGPDDPLMRSQFAKMAVLTMDYTVTVADISTFLDTPADNDPNNPLYPGAYVAVAARNNIILGYASGNFGFWDNLTRQQLITVVVRAAGSVLADPPDDYQGDLNYSDPTHGPNLKKAEYNGLLAGIQDLAAWDTTANATRGETAELLCRLLAPLAVVGPTETEVLTRPALAAMEATEGFGGYRNKLGNITGPHQFTGVSIESLMALVGGGTSVTVFASDGYSLAYSADETAGIMTMYDTAGNEIGTITGDLGLIVAYASAGSGLGYVDGPLRMALVSPLGEQVTASKYWVKQVAKIVVN